MSAPAFLFCFFSALLLWSPTQLRRASRPRVGEREGEGGALCSDSFGGTYQNVLSSHSYIFLNRPAMVSYIPGSPAATLREREQATDRAAWKLPECGLGRPSRGGPFDGERNDGVGRLGWGSDSGQFKYCALRRPPSAVGMGNTMSRMTVSPGAELPISRQREEWQRKACATGRRRRLRTARARLGTTSCGDAADGGTKMHTPVANGGHKRLRMDVESWTVLCEEG